MTSSPGPSSARMAAISSAAVQECVSSASRVAKLVLEPSLAAAGVIIIGLEFTPPKRVFKVRDFLASHGWQVEWNRSDFGSHPSANTRHALIKLTCRKESIGPELLGVLFKAGRRIIWKRCIRPVMDSRSSGFGEEAGRNDGCAAPRCKECEGSDADLIWTYQAHW